MEIQSSHILYIVLNENGTLLTDKIEISVCIKQKKDWKNKKINMKERK